MSCIVYDVQEEYFSDHTVDASIKKMHDTKTMTNNPFASPTCGLNDILGAAYLNSGCFGNHRDLHFQFSIGDAFTAEYKVTWKTQKNGKHNKKRKLNEALKITDK